MQQPFEWWKSGTHQVSTPSPSFIFYSLNLPFLELVTFPPLSLVSWKSGVLGLRPRPPSTHSFLLFPLPLPLSLSLTSTISTIHMLRLYFPNSHGSLLLPLALLPTPSFSDHFVFLFAREVQTVSLLGLACQ